MTTNTSHRDCFHPATKAARATCRKEEAARVAARNLEARTLIDSYYAGGDWEPIIYALMRLLPEELTRAYYDTDDDPDTLIAMANRLRLGL